MADKIGDIVCPVCRAETPVLVDKRGKLYLHCTCGVMKFQTHKGQGILRGLLEAAGKTAPAPAASVEVDQPEVEPAPSEGGRDFGPLALAAGVLIGGLTWWLKKRRTV